MSDDKQAATWRIVTSDMSFKVQATRFTEGENGIYLWNDNIVVAFVPYDVLIFMIVEETKIG